jgi:hypothetical protein
MITRARDILLQGAKDVSVHVGRVKLRIEEVCSLPDIQLDPRRESAGREGVRDKIDRVR